MFTEKWKPSTDTDVLWHVNVRYVDSEGNERILTHGWLRGSHREVDTAPYGMVVSTGSFWMVPLVAMVGTTIGAGQRERALRAVGPFYGLFGLGMALYFASQGAGRLLWPLLANLTRLGIAAGGGWLARSWSSELSHVFLALSVALAAFGLMNAGAVAGGAWFGPIGWPRARG